MTQADTEQNKSPDLCLHHPFKNMQRGEIHSVKEFNRAKLIQKIGFINFLSMDVANRISGLMLLNE